MFVLAGCAVGPSLLGGCSNGDFGRVRPWLVSDGIHDWLGREAVEAAGQPPSTLPLTDDERQLRDLAFPLIEAPYDRDHWNSVLLEWGLVPTHDRVWPPYDPTLYADKLLASDYRSTSARYAQLIDDVRNDVVRVGPFFATARRVLGLDRKRERSMAYISDLNPAERANARARMAENALVVAWVEHSLRSRAAAYRYALERCVVATPSPLAAEAERAINELQERISGSLGGHAA